MITNNLVSVVIKEDSNKVILECLAHDYGINQVQYKWEKYHPVYDRWVEPSERAKTTTSRRLEFGIIKEEDQGTYHCVASNNDGSVLSENATITVYVHRKTLTKKRSSTGQY